MVRFEGKIALVTGGGSGIGEAIAARFAEEGAFVLLVGRTESKLRAAAGRIGKQADFFVADVSREEDIKRMAEYVEKRFGGVDILVNNAGGSKHCRLLAIEGKDWDAVQAVNLRSVFLVSKTIVPLMEGRQEASIINIASLSGIKAGAMIAHYSAAKAGVINLTGALAYELSPRGIRVNAISPGFVETPLTESGFQNQKFMDSIIRHTALRRVGRPEEIAGVAAFLASKDASYITGANLVVDGGWLIS
jgi:meso-butanediol dehydrogenase/(S,S)-butanediol dehydrogenase/diacetyl reductase